MGNGDNRLGETAGNIVENLASRVAENLGGRITPHNLMPYLPMSLGLIRQCLDEMVDGTSVLAVMDGDFPVYEFRKYQDCPAHRGLLMPDHCVACSVDIHPLLGRVFCAGCVDQLTAALSRLADTTGWPSAAVYEHEILFIAANTEPPLYSETLAGRSRYTIRRMVPKLKTLAQSGMLREVVTEHNGPVEYVFPALTYPKDRYRANMEVIGGYPSSRVEETEMRIWRILIMLGWMLLGFLGLGFLLIPFPLLLLTFVIAAPVLSLAIWRRRTEPMNI